MKLPSTASVSPEHGATHFSEFFLEKCVFIPDVRTIEIKVQASAQGDKMGYQYKKGLV